MFTKKKLYKICFLIFKVSRNNYGTRKIKQELFKLGYQVSRRRIGIVMKKYGLVSQYTVKQFKVHRAKYNENKIVNKVNRVLNKRAQMEVIVSDLTYVNVIGKWHYICLLVDLFNREIIGYSAGSRKDTTLVLKAFSKINQPLDQISILHTDRGDEFKNRAIDELLYTFNI